MDLMIDPRRLEILRAFATGGTMAAAADTLFLSTSAVSQQLRILEDEAGLALLDRRGRRATLTEAGAVLVRFAEQMAALAEDAQTTMKRLAGRVEGEVRLSAPPSFASTVLPYAVRDMQRDYPALRVGIRDLEPFEGLRGLRDGSIDLAVIDDMHPYDLTEIDTFVVGVDQIVLCTPDDSTVPPGPVDAGMLADARWILDGSHEVFDDLAVDLCRDAGFEPNIVARCRNVAVTLSLVEAGVGVAVLSEMHTRDRVSPHRVRRFEPPQTRTILLARRRSSRASHLIDVVQALVGDRGTAFLAPSS